MTQSDDLGRVVIPKEIRRTLRLREGTPLEIFTDREGEIILKKYSPMAELGNFAKQYADALAQSTGLAVCVTDRDQVIAVAGGAKKELLQKSISKALEQSILNRNNIMAGKEEGQFIPVTDEDAEEYSGQVTAVILCEGDAIGSVLLLSKDPKYKMGTLEQKLASTAAGFLGRQMESRGRMRLLFGDPGIAIRSKKRYPCFGRIKPWNGKRVIPLKN